MYVGQDGVQEGAASADATEPAEIEMDPMYVGQDGAAGAAASDPGEIEMDPMYVGQDAAEQPFVPIQDPMPMEDPAAAYESESSSFGYDDGGDSLEPAETYAADTDDAGGW
jgi:hypothetical protein